MIDREKVKNALKLCASGCDNNGCSYLVTVNQTGGFSLNRCVDLLSADALELIEELEERIAIMEEGGKPDA